MQCPNCGGKLNKADHDLLECEACRSKFLIQNEAPDYYIVNNFYTQSEVSKDTRGSWKLVVFFPVLAAIVFLFVVGLTKETFVDSPAPKVKQALVQRDRPESEAGISLAEQIFHKPLNQITTDELSQIKYLAVSKQAINEDWQILYGLTPWQADTAEYEAKHLTIPSTKKMDSLDFTAFKGLQFLDLMDTSAFSRNENAFSLAGLEELLYYGHDFNQPLKEILAGLPNPKQLTYLRTQIRSDEEIKDLAEFTNLTGLAVTFLAEEADASLLKELTQLQQLELYTMKQQELPWLAAMSNLKQVSLTNAADISDYSVFYGMPQLTMLSVQRAEQLKDLGFLQNLPNLKRLEISGSGILTLEPLRNKETLGVVKLENNLALADVSALESLSNLTELTLDNAADSLKTASLAHLTFLKEVKLDSDYLGMLEGSSFVQALELRTIFDFDLKQVTQLPNLESLAIHSISGFLENEDSLQQMTQLKQLALYGTRTLYGANGESCLFRLPQLTSLIIGENTSVKVNLDAGFQMSGLEYFSLANSSSLTITKNGSLSTREEAGLTILAEALGDATNLTELYLPSCKLSSLEFARSLNQLKLLDVQDNYISDVGPLTQLPQLQEVNLTKNPITNQDLLPDSVYIVN